MKLVIAIVEDENSINLIDALTDGEYRVTKLATTGGFLKSGNTTLLVGVEEDRVNDVVGIIKNVCKKRKEIRSTPTAMNGAESAIMHHHYPIQVSVGGATVFVIDVDKFIKI